jgi:hypothetical protein
VVRGTRLQPHVLEPATDPSVPGLHAYASPTHPQVPDICLPMVAPGKGLDEMFLPGSITLGEGTAPVMTGEAPS